MRTVTAQDTAILTQPAGMHRTWIKFEIDRDGAGTWVDLSNFNGDDFVLGIEYGEDINTPAWTATIRLALFMYQPGYTLSPFFSGSLLNAGGVLVQPYRRVKISTAIVPDGAPMPSTLNFVFEGRIDSWDVSKGEVTLSCRGKIGVIQDRFIEFVTNYGSTDPVTATAVDIEELIQNITDDHYNDASDIGGTKSALRTNPLSGRTTDGAPIQLYSANGTSGTPFNTSTGFAIRLYRQDKQPLWESLARLSAAIGYQLRYRYHEGSGINDIVLVLENPNRTASSADFTLNPKAGGRILIDRMSLSNVDIRNAARITYLRNGVVADISEDSDAASITKYGRRYFEFQEGSASPINTEAEADALRDSALSDLKEPTMTLDVTTPYLWWAQLNDYVAIEPDDLHFDTQQKLAILSRRNSITQGGPSQTKLVLQGQPKSGGASHVQKHRAFDNPFSFPNKLGGMRLSNPNFSEQRD